MSGGAEAERLLGTYGDFGGLTQAEQARLEADLARRTRTYELNPKQYDFVFDDAHKFPAYIGGIGGGKSFAGAVKALKKMTENPGSLGLIGAPTYTMLRDATMRSVFELFPEGAVKKFNKSDGILTLLNGSECIFRSTDDPNRLRGPNLAWFWLDEAPLCGYEAWRIMKGRLRQHGYEPQGWITGSPRGEDAFYEDFEHDLKPQHFLYRASTRENAHNLPATFIEDLGYTGAFALQEIEGLFVSFEGLVYEFRSEWHMAEWPTERRHLGRRIGGIDWGYTNPAVALPLWLDGDDRVWVRDEFYEREAGYDGVADAAVRFSREYGIETWYCGPDEPEHIVNLNTRLRREGLAAKAVAAVDDINPGLDSVRRQMTLRGDGQAGLFISARCANLRAEFRTYSYPTRGLKRESRDPQEKPVTAFNHALDALRYAVHSTLGVAFHQARLTRRQKEQQVKRAGVSAIAGVSVMRKKF